MGKVHPEKSTSVSTELFHWHSDRQGARYNRLFFWLAVISCSHCSGFEGRNLIVGLECHGRALLQKDDRQHKGRRKEDVDHYSPHIDEIVTQRWVFPESPNYCHQGAKADAR